MRKKTLLTALIALLSVVTAGGMKAQDYRFDLKDAIRYGLENSISIRMAVLDQEKADHKTGEQKSIGLPQITAEGQFQHFPSLPTQLLPGEIIGQPGTQIPVQFGTDFTMSGSIKASQLLYSQQFLTGLKAIKSSRELYDLLKIQTEEQVIYQISAAYYQALQLQTQIASLDSNLTMLNELESLMQVQYENDIVIKTSYNRVKVGKSNLATQIQSLRTAYVQQVNYLKLLMGMPIENTLVLQQPDELESVSLSSLEMSRSNPIQLEILAKQTELNVLNKEVTKAGYYPTLALFGQQTFQAQRNEFNFFDTRQPWYRQTVWGLQLQVPLFDGLKKHHQMEQHKLNITQLNLQQDQAEEQLDMQYENAREQLMNSLASVEVQEENRTLAKEVYDQTQLLYKEQVATLTELLDAEQAYREAQTNYYNEILKFKKSELDLMKAQGQLKTLVQ